MRSHNWHLPKKKIRLFLLFLTTVFCIQGLPWFGSPELLPVYAHSPSGVTLVQSSQSPTALVQQGKALYEAGQFSEAAAILKEAAEAFKERGDVLRQAMALSNLSLAYQQLGSWSEAEQVITESLDLLQSNTSNLPREKKSERFLILAQTLEIQGRLQLSLGRAEQALSTWQQAAATYSQMGNKDGIVQSYINQAQALQSLGLYPRACKTLLSALGTENPDCQISEQQLQTLTNQPDSIAKAIALRSLGDTLQLVGDLQQSETVLKLSLEMAQRLQSPANISSALFSLGNNARARAVINPDQQTRQTTEGALAYYQQAAQESTSSTTRIQAQLNQLSLLIETQQLSEARVLASQIQSELANLPPSRTAIYARINLAESLMKLSPPDNDSAARLLATAVEQAKGLGDQRATTYALGNLARVYEETGQVNEAKGLTDQALLLAQTINAPDIAYRWQWQLGRLLKAQGKRNNAIAAYNSAISTLNSIRKDLVSINPDVQFSFRESVEPIYREYVELLLQSQGTQADAQNLELARNAIESLQLAELVNFFREDCLTGTPIQIDEIDSQAAVIYPIVLADRLEVVLSLPNAPLRHFATRKPREEVEEVFDQLRQAIAPFVNDPNQRGVVQETETNPNPSKQVNSKDGETDSDRGIGVEPRDCSNRGIGVEPRCYDLPSAQEYLPLARQVYDWVIRPVQADIAASGVKTLVFVLDAPMLNLPMAVLNDGQQFLIENYAIAYTPGLQLLDSKRQVRGQMSALKAGLSEARQGFDPLPFVDEELKKIQLQVSGELLLNESFTTAAIQKEMDSVPFPVVHLATHGQFSSKQEDTFILTWDSRLNVNQLNSVLQAREEIGRNPIELLVLSACQTAAGDKRAALGLAGVAVRAGARSTLATLWFVSDAGTAELMTRFYQELTDTTISKAEALRRAQVSLLKDSKYQQPLYWAPYVLVGNWL